MQDVWLMNLPRFSPFFYLSFQYDSFYWFLEQKYMTDDSNYWQHEDDNNEAMIIAPTKNG